MAEESVYDIEYNTASLIVEQAIQEHGANHLALHVESCEGGYLIQMTNDNKNYIGNEYISNLSPSLPYLEALDCSLKLADEYHLRWAPN